MTYYFAFGSNLNLEQMHRRCPSAIPVGPAILMDWQLSFTGKSVTWGGGVATIKRRKGKYTPGVLYRLSQEDITTLDRFEGHPFCYERRKVTVELLGNRSLTAYVYIHQEKTPAMPTIDYLKTIARGYNQFGLDLSNLTQAIKQVRDLKCLKTTKNRLPRHHSFMLHS